ncbi:phage tail tube protein [Nocardia colli]|uniref:phage tail tube protein n=1 Tax=Nocardia colli TaxID=2545717 RepID=UPI0035D9940C
MPTDTSKVYTPQPPKVRGVIYRAPLGTTVPADATTALAATFKDQGGISDAGIVNSQAREVTKIKDFGGKTIATPQNDYTETLKVVFVESTNLETLKSVYGDLNVQFTPATPTKGAVIRVDHSAAALPESVWITETVQGTSIKRQIVPIGKPITVGDVVQINNDVVKYEVTIEAYEYTNGTDAFFIREYHDDGKPTGS